MGVFASDVRCFTLASVWMYTGAIRDMTDSYPLCIHSQSLCIALCCLVWIVEYVYDYMHGRTKAVPEH